MNDLVKYFSIRGGVFLKEIASVKAVDGVDLTINEVARAQATTSMGRAYRGSPIATNDAQ